MGKINKEKIKTWFVTGASSGVGYEMCKQLLARGYQVIAISRRIADFESPNVLCLSCDVTDPNSVKIAIKLGIEKFGKIDVLVNNAGKLTSQIIENEKIEHIKDIFEVNFYGAFNTMNALIPHFRENKNGTIINNTSKSGIAPRKYGAAYCSSKFALEGLTGVCYRECANFIRTMAFELGWYPSSGIKSDLEFSEKNIPKIYHDCKNIDLKVKTKLKNNLEKTISLIISEVENEVIPRRLMLGTDGISFAESELNLFEKDFKYSKSLLKNCCDRKKEKFNFFEIKEETNYMGNKHKIITILGIKIKLKK